MGGILDDGIFDWQCEVPATMVDIPWMVGMWRTWLSPWSICDASKLAKRLGDFDGSHLNSIISGVSGSTGSRCGFGMLFRPLFAAGTSSGAPFFPTFSIALPRPRRLAAVAFFITLDFSEIKAGAVFTVFFFAAVAFFLWVSAFRFAILDEYSLTDVDWHTLRFRRLSIGNNNRNATSYFFADQTDSIETKMRQLCHFHMFSSKFYSICNNLSSNK